MLLRRWILTISVCNNCGQTQGYDYAKDFIAFYENRHRFYKESVYIRKYYIINTVYKIQTKYNVNVTYKERDNIYKIFKLLSSNSEELNNGRKRMVSINFLIKAFLALMNNADYHKIPTTKCRKTMQEKP